ncbi:enamine deaminase RidA [Pseudarthrobacter sulfonivorans]|uniref:Enamine deaminase RidA n=1 Tax=Pseudarthrobacter sulfonivorans TaxID=121292 RepID=A0A0U3QP66_9MICC|nr:RidA family protein [Pseudarthrobacter sulfonivorans]ALV41397.1 enamine deaminase RidA [Pseudarthrobacter sulfonivorans]
MGQNVLAPVPELTNAPDLTPPLGHYSHVSVVGGTAYISGQLPVNAQGTPITDQPFEAQVEQTLSNMDSCLAAVGVDRSALVQVRVYVTDIQAWGAFDKIYSSWIGSHCPARAVAGVKELHFGAAVEVEAIAVTRDTL